MLHFRVVTCHSIVVLIRLLSADVPEGGIKGRVWCDGVPSCRGGDSCNNLSGRHLSSMRGGRNGSDPLVLAVVLHQSTHGAFASLTLRFQVLKRRDSSKVSLLTNSFRINVMNGCLGHVHAIPPGYGRCAREHEEQCYYVVFFRHCNYPWNRCHITSTPTGARTNGSSNLHGGSARVRVGRAVRRRYLARRAASRATPTMTSTTANMTMATSVCMVIASRSALYGLRSAGEELRCPSLAERPRLRPVLR